MVPDRDHITENAKKRLQALQTMEDLGSGFSIASRDLEIRGAGALLGDSQSGEIQEIGFALYNRILSKKIVATTYFLLKSCQSQNTLTLTIQELGK